MEDFSTAGEIGQRLAASLPILRRNFEIAQAKTEELNPERRLNVAFYLGQQWVEYDQGIGLVPTTTGVEDIEPIVNNVIRPILDDRCAVIINSTPKMEVVATTQQLADLTNAKLANQAAEAFWHKYALQNLFSQAHLVAALKYNVFVFVDWNYLIGRVKKVGNTFVPEGDIQLELVPPENVFVDPRADRVTPEGTEPTNAQWLFRLKTVDIGEILQHPYWQTRRIEKSEATGTSIFYGGVPPEEEITAMQIEDYIPEKEVSASIGKSGSPGKMVRLLIYIERQSGAFPHGRYAVIMPDNNWHILEYREELPYATKSYPGLFNAVMWVDSPMPGRLAGNSRVTDARPLQVEINRILTQWRDLRNNVRPWLLVDEDSGITAETLQRANSVFIARYRSSIGGAEPKLVWPGGLMMESQTAMNEIVWLIHQIEDKIGIHSPAYHPHKEGTTLGEIQLIELKDQMRLKNNEAQRAEIGFYAPTMKLILQLAQRFFSEERLVSFFGSAGKATVRRFKGADLQFQDLMIKPGSSMELSRGLQIALTLRAAELGLFQSQDPMEARMLKLDFADALSLGITAEMTIDQMQRQVQRDENVRMVDGEEPAIEFFHDDAIHMQEIVRFLLSADFINLPKEQKDAVRMRLLAHYNLHKEKLSSNNEIAGLVQGALLEENQHARQFVGGLIGGAIPTADGRMLVPQEMPGTPKSGNLIGGKGLPQNQGQVGGFPETPAGESPQ